MSRQIRLHSILWFGAENGQQFGASYGTFEEVAERLPKKKGNYAGNSGSFFFTRTTVIFAKPSSNAGAFSLAAMRRMMSSGTTRSRR
jgi:hypothetical protein